MSEADVLSLRSSISWFLMLDGLRRGRVPQRPRWRIDCYFQCLEDLGDLGD